MLHSHKVHIPVKGESKDNDLHKKHNAGNVQAFCRNVLCSQRGGQNWELSFLGSLSLKSLDHFGSRGLWAECGWPARVMGCPLEKAQCCSPASPLPAQLTQGLIFSWKQQEILEILDTGFYHCNVQLYVLYVNAFIAVAGDFFFLGSFHFTKQNYMLREHLGTELSLHREGLTAVYMDVR